LEKNGEKSAKGMAKFRHGFFIGHEKAATKSPMDMFHMMVMAIHIPSTPTSGYKETRLFRSVLGKDPELGLAFLYIAEHISNTEIDPGEVGRPEWILFYCRIHEFHFTIL